VFGQKSRLTIGVTMSAVLCVAFFTVGAQDRSPKKTDSIEAAERDQVVIDRKSLHLIDPKAFRASLQLEPIRFVKLASSMAGMVRSVLLEPGAKVQSQSEAIRLDDTEQLLLVDRAKANHKVAQIERRRAKKQNDDDLVELAEAKLAAAKADLDLAKYRHRRASIRVPFAGEVFRVHVLDGQLVGVGEPLMEIGDTSRLRVELPVDRLRVKAGDVIDLKLDLGTVRGTVKRIVPLAERFETLRELVGSVASAIVVVENSDGKYKAGQTVYSEIIPRQYIAEVLNRCLGNIPDGRRKVQVIRKGVIRDVTVTLLGQVGEDSVYVTGAFDTGDEVILHSSKHLSDGTQVQSLAVAAADRQTPPPAGTVGRKRKSGEKRPAF